MEFKKDYDRRKKRPYFCTRIHSVHNTLLLSFGGVKITTQTPQKITFGYTAITPEIKKMIHDILSAGESYNGLAHELNLGYRARTTAIKKILGTTTNPYKTIRKDIVEKIRAKHQLLKK